MDWTPRLIGIFGLLGVMIPCGLPGQQSALSKKGLDGLEPVAFKQLSDRVLSARAKAALALDPERWLHSETDNFVYHYFNSYVATPVAVEAEFYYRVIAGDLNRETDQWERKGHIFLFEEPALWQRFQTDAQLDPWTGGIHAGDELFLLRDRARKFKGRTLGHEVAHLVLHRFFGAGLPLWANEGYAEYASIIGYASFHRARGYNARPRSAAVESNDYIPLVDLTEAIGYPEDESAVTAFYRESERLVRFLSGKGEQRFKGFMEALAAGNRFETALARNYQGVFSSTAELESQFRPYASEP